MGKLITKNPEHKMVFTKYVEIGRIVVVGQAIYTIVDVIDNRHVMIDSPKKDSRKKINITTCNLPSSSLNSCMAHEPQPSRRHGRPLAWTPSGLRPHGPRKWSRRTSELVSAISSDSRS